MKNIVIASTKKEALRLDNKIRVWFLCTTYYFCSLVTFSTCVQIGLYRVPQSNCTWYNGSRTGKS